MTRAGGRRRGSRQPTRNGFGFHAPFVVIRTRDPLALKLTFFPRHRSTPETTVADISPLFRLREREGPAREASGRVRVGLSRSLALDCGRLTPLALRASRPLPEAKGAQGRASATQVGFGRLKICRPLALSLDARCAGDKLAVGDPRPSKGVTGRKEADEPCPSPDTIIRPTPFLDLCRSPKSGAPSWRSGYCPTEARFEIHEPQAPATGAPGREQQVLPIS